MKENLNKDLKTIENKENNEDGEILNDVISNKVKYENNKISLIDVVNEDEEILLYIQPDEKIFLENIKFETVKFHLENNDILLELTNGGVIRLVSMGLLMFEDTPIVIEFFDKTFSSNDIIDKIDMLNELEDKYATYSSKPIEIKNNIVSDKQEEVEETIVEKNTNTNNLTATDDTNNKLIEQIEEVNESDYESNYISNNKLTNINPYTETEITTSKNIPLKITEESSEGVDLSIKFDMDVQHVYQIEIEENNVLEVIGGGGINYSNANNELANIEDLSKQGAPELIDYSYLTSDDYTKLIIKAEDSDIFNNDLTSRLLTFNVEQPTGFSVTKFVISNIPEGVSVLNGTEISTGIWEIEENTENVKSSSDTNANGYTINDNTGEIEFVIQYDTDLNIDFDINVYVESTWNLENLPEDERINYKEPISTTLNLDKNYAINIKSTNEENLNTYNFDTVYGTLENEGEIPVYDTGFVLSTKLNGNEIYGGHLDNEVYGGVSDDKIITFEGDDIIDSGTGNDIIDSGTGNDYIDGGEGIDLISFDNFNIKDSNPTEGVFVDLLNNISTGDGIKEILNIENISGSIVNDILYGDNNNNTIFGNSGNDILNGNSGNDILYGNSGNDIIIGGNGNDILYGGDGNDTIDLSNENNGMVIELQTEEGLSNNIEVGRTFSNDNSDTGLDTLYEIENVIGSKFNDLITDNKEDNIIDGNEGIDTLDYSFLNNGMEINLLENYTYGNGNDIVYNIENIIGTDFNDNIKGDSSNNILDGQDGNDILNGGSGNDVLYSSRGTDELNGGFGIDEISFLNSEQSINFNLYNNDFQDVNIITNLNYIENLIKTEDIENITGSVFSDILNGNDGSNVIYGGDGDDIISGYGVIGTGYDEIDGGLGNDTIDFTYIQTGGITIDLSSTEVQNTNNGDLLISNIENVNGTMFADNIKGNDEDNILLGNEGNDIIYGSLGNDYMDGGSGYNILSFEENNNLGVEVDMNLSKQIVNDGYNGNDTALNFDEIIGSNLNDIFSSGELLNDILRGGDGNDIFYTSAGNDILDGQNGDDIFKITSNLIGGNTLIDGGNEITDDIVDFVEFSEGINLKISDTNNITMVKTLDDKNIVQIKNIEKIIGTSFNDIMEGNSGVNNIDGGAGDDIIKVTQGNDILSGGSNTGIGDTISFEKSINGIVVSLNSNIATNNNGDWLGNVTVYNFENIIGSLGDDILTGNSSTNIIDGNGGNDTISYYDYDYSVNVDLSNQDYQTIHTFSDNTEDIDKIININNLISSEFSDNIITSNDDNVIDTKNGDDIIYLSYDDGVNIIDGGIGVDTVDYSSLDNTTYIEVHLSNNNYSTVEIFGNSSSNDEVINIENVIGTDGSDIIYGNNLDNYIDSGLGNDIISGYEGNDVLNGGEGNDTLDYSNIDFYSIDIDYKKTNDISTINTIEYKIIFLSNGDENYISSIENINGTNLSDTIFFNSEDNIINSGLGNDILNGGFGDDVINGEEGNDTLYVLDIEDGNDIYDGGLGNDTLSFELLENPLSGTNTGVNIDMSTSTSDSEGYIEIIMDDLDDSNGTYEIDKIKSIENITGSIFNDTLKGDSNNNIIDGNIGDDYIYASLGNDILNGGEGNDTIDYGSFTENIIINNGAVSIGTDKVDYLISIENILTGQGDDTFYMTDDLKYNLIDAGEGNDTINYSKYNNSITIDLYEDGEETEQVILTRNSTDDIDKIINIENIIGTNYNDTINGNSEDNLIDSGKGNDIINAEGGSNTINSGIGNDTIIMELDTINGSNDVDIIDGGEGSDTIDYSNITNNISIEVNLNSSSQSDAIITTSDGDTYIDKITNIENIITNDGNDIINGGEQNNYIETKDGVDIINSEGGNDVIYSGDGNDIINSGTGIDKIYSGAGDDFIYDTQGDKIYNGGDDFDTLDFSQYNILGKTGLNLDLNNETQIIDGFTKDIIDIEKLIGSIYSDTFIMSNSNNVIDGNNGIDSVDYSDSTNLVNVNLETNSSTGWGNDTLTNIENIIGSDYNDILTGTDTENVINSGIGNDTIDGNGGNDVINTGDNDDKIFINIGSTYIDGGNGNDTIDTSKITNDLLVNLNLGIVQTENGTVDNSIENIENVIGGESNETFVGNEYDNDFNGNGGLNTISFEGILFENDDLHGLFIDMSNNTSTDINNDEDVLLGMESLNLTGNDLDVIIGNDTFSNIQNITGTDKIDYIIGDDNNNLIEGKSGDDFIVLTKGDDTIDGGIGSDTLYLSDYFNGTSYNINIDLENNFLNIENSDGDIVNDYNTTILNIENVIGTENNDLIIGSLLNNTLIGGEGDDKLYAVGTSTDELYGGEGSDTLYYSLNGINNIYDGESGNDILSLSNNIDGYLIDMTITEQINIDGNISNFYNIEKVIGSIGSDTFITNVNENNIIDGGVGVEYDTVDYSNVIISDSISDYVDVDLSNSIVDLYSSSSIQSSDNISNIEIIRGTYGNDIFKGDNSENIFYGNDGEDTFIGTSGNDIYYGGNEDDLIDYSLISTSINIDLTLNEASGSDIDLDQLYDIQNLKTGSGEDIVKGNENSNVIYTYSGNDYIYATSGLDIIDMGNGESDTFDYSYYDNNIIMDFSNIDQNNYIQVTNENNEIIDYIKNVENFIGTDYNDFITGDEENNILDGGLGSDTFFYSEGNDKYDGNIGTDTLDFSSSTANYNIDLNNIETDIIDKSNNSSVGSIINIENYNGTNNNDTVNLNYANNNNILFGTGTLDTLNILDDYSTFGLNVNNVEVININNIIGSNVDINMTNDSTININNISYLDSGSIDTNIDSNVIVNIGNSITSNSSVDNIGTTFTGNTNIILNINSIDNLNNEFNVNNLLNKFDNNIEILNIDYSSTLTFDSGYDITTNLSSLIDNIISEGGNGIINTNAGNDYILENGSSNKIYTGDGDDIIDVNGSIDIIDGGNNNDTFNIFSDGGTGYIYGRGGGDIFNITNGNFDIYSDNSNLNSIIGNDSFNISGGENIIKSGDGEDTFTINGGENEIFAGDGNDTFNISESILVSSSANIRGEIGTDVFNLSGSAYVSGGDGVDTFNILNIIGNDSEGNISITNGDSGNDIFNIDNDTNGIYNGGIDDDTFNISYDNSGTFNGGDNNDTFNISSDNSGTFNGDSGNDTFQVTSDNNSILYGDTGNDVFNINNDSSSEIHTGSGYNEININNDSKNYDNDIYLENGNNTLIINSNFNSNIYDYDSIGDNTIYLDDSYSNDIYYFNININLNDGDDEITENSSYINGNINMGDGNDTFNVNYYQNDDLIIDMGADEDTLNLSNENDINIHTNLGDGNDEIIFNNIEDLNFKSNNIEGGNGEDTLILINDVQKTSGNDNGTSGMWEDSIFNYMVNDIENFYVSQNEDGENNYLNIDLTEDSVDMDKDLASYWNNNEGRTGEEGVDLYFANNTDIKFEYTDENGDTQTVNTNANYVNGDTDIDNTDSSTTFDYAAGTNDDGIDYESGSFTIHFI